MLVPENEEAITENVAVNSSETKSDNTEVKQIEPIAVVMCSRGSEKDNADAIRHLQLMALFPIHVYFYQNGGFSLPSVYNQIMNQVNETRVVFIHDDAEPISAGWARTLWTIFENNPEYGIIGVAGSKDFDADGAWWLYKNKVGAVFHRKDVKDDKGNTGYITFRTVYSPELETDVEEVCLIDGLFIAIDKTRIKHQFDESVAGFNFYDINLCLDNFIDHSTKIGVTTKIRLSHKGLGVIKPEWFVNRKKTITKYTNFLPISNLQINTPVEDKIEVDIFKPENDPIDNGQIKLLTPEEAEQMRKEQELKQKEDQNNGNEENFKEGEQQ